MNLEIFKLTLTEKQIQVISHALSSPSWQRATGPNNAAMARSINRVLIDGLSRSYSDQWRNLDLTQQVSPREIECADCRETKPAFRFYYPTIANPTCKDCADAFWDMLGDDPCGKNWEP